VRGRHEPLVTNAGIETAVDINDITQGTGYWFGLFCHSDIWAVFGDKRAFDVIIDRRAMPHAPIRPMISKYTFGQIS
jgi:hypothetical protein